MGVTSAIRYAATLGLALAATPALATDGLYCRFAHSYQCDAHGCSTSTGPITSTIVESDFHYSRCWAGKAECEEFHYTFIPLTHLNEFHPKTPYPQVREFSA